MKLIAAAALALAFLVGACERQKSKAAPLAGKSTIDQTPELDAHPRALAATGSTIERSPATPVPPEYDMAVKKYFDERKPLPAETRDGFTATANHTCPIMQKMKLNASTAVEHTVQFEGKVIGFCCADCVDAWASMGDDERRAMLTTVLNKK